MPHEQPIDLIGEVRAADLDQMRFWIRLDDDRKIEGIFPRALEETITLALRDHKKLLRVKGRGEFSGPGGKLERITQVEEMAVQPEEVRYDPSARPIWEIAAELGASIPEEEWDKVPGDLARNLDHYLYGAPKEDE